MSVAIRKCSKHGLTNFRFDGKVFRCTKCATANSQKRRLKVKQLAVEYKGGKCEICGYSKCLAALEFHHLDSKEKDFNITTGNNKSWKRIKLELDKCQLVCSNCHREIHNGA